MLVGTTSEPDFPCSKASSVVKLQSQPTEKLRISTLFGHQPQRQAEKAKGPKARPEKHLESEVFQKRPVHVGSNKQPTNNQQQTTNHKRHFVELTNVSFTLFTCK